MSGQGIFILGAAVVVALMVTLLRNRRLREKYAALWLIVAIAVLALAINPALLRWMARLTGVQTPSNLLFGLAILLLLSVTIHLSLEISRLEDETRVLAENVAILNAQVRELTDAERVGQSGLEVAHTEPIPLPAVEGTPATQPESAATE